MSILLSTILYGVEYGLLLAGLSIGYKMIKQDMMDLPEIYRNADDE